VSITGAITGILMLFQPSNDSSISQKIYNGLILNGKIIQKSDENTWNNSFHEETFQITKDTILRFGGLK
tara:strand:- start:215 stop:421 length:207 start_codon:yes stop_codon:yes gene_type:complete